jgi:ankyrin repeat protein
VAAVRPLRLGELAEVLAVDFVAEGIPNLNLAWRWEDQEEAVMSACSSLVVIVKDGDSRIVQFSHFSVKEFLTANRLAEPIRDVSRYHIRLEAAHTVLGQACLGVLLRLDDRVDRDMIENFPLAQYAAQYWPTHAQFGNASSHVMDGMKCLFDADKPHFAAWLWIYNGDYADGRPMSTMCPEKPEASPLYYAAMLGYRDLAEHLIAEHPEYVTARGGPEQTPTHVAARVGHADILSLLLEHGADVDARGHNGQTPLHRASWRRKVEAGQCLLDHGADINARNNSGITPLGLAAYQDLEFTRMLVEHGARVDDHDSDGWTSLHWAIQSRNVQIVQLLLEHGANVNARDNSGNTPSQFGLARSIPEIAELLSKYGAEPVE